MNILSLKQVKDREGVVLMDAPLQVARADHRIAVLGQRWAIA